MVTQTIVCTSSDYDRMINAITTQQLIAFDTEYTDQKLGLIQIATKAQVYLVDFVALGNTVSWQKLANVINGEQVVKLGFAAASDLHVLTENLKLQFSNSKAIIDLQKLNDFMKTKGFPYTNQLEGNDLQTLVSNVLGQQLDKKLQRSNWTTRPLNSEQLAYAAKDASILFDVFEKFNSFSISRGVGDLKFPHLRAQFA